jgi:integrase
MQFDLNLWLKYKALVSNYYIKREYTKYTISRCNSFFSHCSLYFKDKAILTGQEIHDYYVADYPNRTARNYLCYLNKAIYYERHKAFPTTNLRYWIHKEYLTEEFQLVIDNYIQIESKTNKKKKTIANESISGKTFFFHMQSLGRNKLGEITENDIISFFLNNRQELAYSVSYLKNLRKILYNNLKVPNIDKTIIRKLLIFLPQIGAHRKNIQYFEDWEIQKIHDCLLNKSSPLTKRDRAIGLIILFYGIRGCDVINLNLSSIDWTKETITFIQQKTSKENSFKFNVAVGNALYDYIVNDRPKVENEKIFQTFSKPYCPLSITYNISIKILKICKIRQHKDDRKGFHLYRHKLATKMLENNVPIPIISCVLGHSTPKSTETYLSMDFIHLKEFGLDISIFDTKIKEKLL